MRTVKTQPTGLLMCALLLVIAPAVSCADEGHGETTPPVHDREDGDGGHVGTGEPAGLAETWTALEQTREAISADVNAGKLGEVHEKAEQLTLLMGSLLEHSAALEPQKRDRVQAAANQISKVAGLLHEAADAGDEPRTRRELKRLDGLLGLIRAQYPEGSPEDHHPDSGAGHPGAPDRTSAEHSHEE